MQGYSLRTINQCQRGLYIGQMKIEHQGGRGALILNYSDLLASAWQRDMSLPFRPCRWWSPNSICRFWHTSSVRTPLRPCTLYRYLCIVQHVRNRTQGDETWKKYRTLTLTLITTVSRLFPWAILPPISFNSFPNPFSLTKREIHPSIFCRSICSATLLTPRNLLSRWEFCGVANMPSDKGGK